jgi:uncharacterized membrane protein
MLITKIFHLHQPLNEAREQLRDLSTWSDTKAESAFKFAPSRTNGVSRIEFPTPNGQSVTADIEEVPGTEPNHILFRSVGGDIELAGLVEFFTIRTNLTEVVLTVEYEPASRLQRAFESIGAAVDRFLNRQLAKLDHSVGPVLSERFA